MFLLKEKGCCLLQAGTVRHSSEFHRVMESTTDLMLVDLSGKVVHRGFLSAPISSGCSLLPLSNSPADFRGVIMGRKHMDQRKMARRTLHLQPFPFPTNPLP